MSTFKDLAYKILKEANEPLHSKKITDLALKQGLSSDGKTPEMTMNALLIVDINTHKEKSRFKKTAPSTFCINPNFKETSKKKEKQYSISKNISTQQKGSIAEARIAELIMLYGKTALSCYKPISDDEGIDLIVKERGRFKKTMYIQIKSRFGVGDPGIYTATVKEKTLIDNYSMAMVFCYFDSEKGDIGERLWFVPAPAFRDKANKLKGGRFGFVAGFKKKESNKWDKFLIDKRDLTNKIVEQMGRI